MGLEALFTAGFCYLEVTEVEGVTNFSSSLDEINPSLTNASEVFRITVSFHFHIMVSFTFMLMKSFLQDFLSVLTQSWR